MPVLLYLSGFEYNLTPGFFLAGSEFLAVSCFCVHNSIACITAAVVDGVSAVGADAVAALARSPLRSGSRSRLECCCGGSAVAVAVPLLSRLRWGLVGLKGRGRSVRPGPCKQRNELASEERSVARDGPSDRGLSRATPPSQRSGIHWHSQCSPWGQPRSFIEGSHPGIFALCDPG